MAKSAKVTRATEADRRTIGLHCKEVNQVHPGAIPVDEMKWCIDASRYAKCVPMKPIESDIDFTDVEQYRQAGYVEECKSVVKKTSSVT